MQYVLYKNMLIKCLATRWTFLRLSNIELILKLLTILFCIGVDLYGIAKIIILKMEEWV